MGQLHYLTMLLWIRVTCNPAAIFFDPFIIQFGREKIFQGNWIDPVNVSNLDEFQNYITPNASQFEKYDARFRVRGDSYEVV